MAFKKSNIMFDEIPKVGSKNAITSDAVSKMGGGIPLYKIRVSSSQWVSPSTDDKELQYTLTFDTHENAAKFFEDYAMVSFIVGDFYTDSELTQKYSVVLGQYTTSVGVLNPTPFATSKNVYFKVNAKCTNTTSQTLYLEGFMIFVKKSDLTNFNI